jgi:hypothetical protein
MGGVVQVPWYATVWRGDRLEAALEQIAPLALRYGASQFGVYRSRDDPYKLLQFAHFESKLDWERYWDGPDFIAWRAEYSSFYQVPILYGWHDLVIHGALAANANGGAAAL